MFQKYFTKYQSPHTANIWQHMLKHKEMTRNNFRTTGNVKQAKEFVTSVHTYKPHTHFVTHGEHVIFTSKALAGQLSPAYAFTKD